MILKRRCQLALTRITHQVSRAFDLKCKHAVLDLLTGLRYNEHNHEKVSVRKRLTVLVENFAHDDW